MISKAKKISLLAISFAIVVVLSTTIIMAAKDDPAAEQAVQAPGPRQAAGQQVNTYWEEITDIGLNPQTRVLDAVTKMKLTYGFDNFEFVSFWVDWDNDGLYETGNIYGGPTYSEYAGTAVAFIPNPPAGTTAASPVMYSISTPVSPPPGLPAGSVRKVKAILSWGTPPVGPGYNPVFGNVIVRKVRFDPIH